jgi:hypothetical protein
MVTIYEHLNYADTNISTRPFLTCILILGLVAFGLVAFGLVAFGLVAFGLVAFVFLGDFTILFSAIGFFFVNPEADLSVLGGLPIYNT